MIKLTKGPKPKILEDKADEWLKLIEDKEAAGEEPTKNELSKYTHADIKAELLKETHNKCAYCESILTHIAYGDVEHIVPKKLGHKYRFKWENLTIACDICNTGKGSHENIVDPYEDDPDEEFAFCGAFVFSLPNKNKAIRTEKLLRLNRPSLIEKRAERMGRVAELVRTAIQMTDTDTQKVLLDDIHENELADSVEYSAVCREFVKYLIDSGHMPAGT